MRGCPEDAIDKPKSDFENLYTAFASDFTIGVEDVRLFDVTGREIPDIKPQSHHPAIVASLWQLKMKREWSSSLSSYVESIKLLAGRKFGIFRLSKVAKTGTKEIEAEVRFPLAFSPCRFSIGNLSSQRRESRYHLSARILEAALSLSEES